MASKNRLRRVRDVLLSPFVGMAKGFVEAGKKVWNTGKAAYTAFGGGKTGMLAGIAAGIGISFTAGPLWFADGVVDGTIDCAANGPGKAWDEIPFQADVQPDIPLEKTTVKILGPVVVGLERGFVEAGKKVGAVAKAADAAAGGGVLGKIAGFFAGAGALIPAVGWFADGFVDGAADCAANGFNKARANIPYNEDLAPNVPRVLSMTAGALTGMYGAAKYCLRESWKSCFRDNDHPVRRVLAFLISLGKLPFYMAQGVIQGADRGSEGWQQGIEAGKHFSKAGVGGIATLGSIAVGIVQGAAQGFPAYQERFADKLTEWFGGEDIAHVQAFYAGIASIGAALMTPYSAIMGGVHSIEGAKKSGFPGYLSETGFEDPTQTWHAPDVESYTHKKANKYHTESGRYDAKPVVPPYIRSDVSSLGAYRAAQIASGKPPPTVADLRKERERQQSEKIQLQQLGPTHRRK